MKYILHFVFFLFVVEGYSQSINENQTVFADKKYTALIKEARDSVKALMNAKKIPGISICISKNGKIIWAESFGYSDLENKIPVRLNTKFRVGSVSKAITAVGLARLMDAGKINLDSSVQHYAPSFPVKKYPITVRHLTSHTGGIRHYANQTEVLNTKPYSSVQESIRIFKDDSLLFQPGTKHFYSSYGFNLLSAAMEGAAAVPFLKYMQQEVFIPLNMYNTTADYTDSIILNRTRFYENRFNKIINAPFVDNSNKWAGGGFLSTPIDLVKMGQALMVKKFITATTVEQLWTPYKLSTGEKNIYGIGFRIETDNAGRKQVHHGGVATGSGALLMIYPDDGLIMAITYNLVPQNMRSTQIAQVFLKQ